MMDPVGTVMAIFEIFDAIKTQIETVIANRNQCRLLASRIESLHLTLKAYALSGFFFFSSSLTPFLVSFLFLQLLLLQRMMYEFSIFFFKKQTPFSLSHLIQAGKKTPI